MLSPVKMIDAGPGGDMLLVRPLAALDSAGFRTFDQEHDGRVSIEDLRRSMCDLEITMQSGELEILFNHFDADHDDFISETEWSRVMEADPSLGLAYQHPGVRRMPSKYACDKDAYNVRT
jgi:hypothetical protein